MRVRRKCSECVHAKVMTTVLLSGSTFMVVRDGRTYKVRDGDIDYTSSLIRCAMNVWTKPRKLETFERSKANTTAEWCEYFVKDEEDEET